MREENLSDKQLSDDIREWSHQLDDEKLVIFEEYLKTLKRSKNEEEDEEEILDIDDEDYPVKIKELSLYRSPIGPVLVPELTDPTKHFKLWTMYSKVMLTKNILLDIEDTLGVETIEILTPYRARIGIAPLFQDGPILKNITKIIHNSTLPDIKN